MPNTVSVDGGSGDSNADQGHFHMSTSLPCNVGSPPPPPPPTGIDDVSSSQISLSPNPVNDFVNLDISQLNKRFIEGAEVMVFDVFGKLVHVEILQNAAANNLLIDFSHQAPGLYILNFKSKDTLVKIKFTKK